MAWPLIACAAGVHSHSTVGGDLVRLTSSGPAGCPLRASARASAAVRPVLAVMLATDGVQQRRLGEAGADRVDGDAGRRELDRQRARQADDAVLGGAVGRDVGIALQAGGRGDEDDPPRRRPPLRVTSRQRRLHGQERAGQVDVEHALPVRQVESSRAGALSAAPALAMTMSIGPCAARAASTIAAQSASLVTSATMARGLRQVRRHLLQRRRAAPGDRDRRAGFRERRGDRRADAACRRR